MKQTKYIIAVLAVLLLQNFAYAKWEIPEDKKQLKNPLEFSGKNILKGKKLYQDNGCAGCHGMPSEGSNISPTQPDLGSKKILAHPDGELFYKMTEGGGAGMPPYSGSISEEDRWAITAYIRSFDSNAKELIVGTLDIPEIKMGLSINQPSKEVIAKVEEVKTDGQMATVENAEVAFFVKRMFGKMKLGTATTNLSGEAKIKLPSNLSGTETGELELVAEMADVGSYGEVAQSLSAPVGRKAQVENLLTENSLWGPAANTPLWLIFSFFGCLILTFLVIIYVLVGMFRLKKMK